MTSRILAAFLVLTGGLIIGALLPLGYTIAGQYRHDYESGTLELARAMASTAEEGVEDHDGAAGLPDRLAAVRHGVEGGDRTVVTVVDRKGRIIVGRDTGLYTPGRAAVGLRGQSRVSELGDRLLAIVPVGVEDERVKGTVLLTRPLAPLRDRVDRLWTRLGVVAFLAVVTAVVLAVYLARWVGRPLRRLGVAAEALGAGDLAARAEPPRRPPEVRGLAERFNVMAARLENLIYDSRAVLADVSHQLRTPLSALRLRMELLAEEARSGGGQADVAEFEAALEELSRLSRMVDGLLAVARAENTTTPPQSIPVTELLRDRVDAWRPVAAERGVELILKAGAPLTAMLGPGRLEQAIDNLVDNALTATSKGGHVWIGAGRAGHRVRVIVADDGPGMSPEAMAEAFRRFRTGRAGGTGLGLPIVHRLITADGGDVTLSETPGGGLTVTLDLPTTR
ncbi:HAMP domain-containing histidine kinase [Actinoallomurus spadix]|uniref:histidine kinase n=1 Tax=Actinoallomurus spadix TaxID=79912 RepID=A0ABP3GQZ8_9ACTN|nr:HAMP domain-containing sensor histidine kinase [Actinoallomurus spadix]MCO5989666.1 HAMP domain-containing histidine kinase [Actinoallomurus spadix]